jgi:hypothetical protein
MFPKSTTWLDTKAHHESTHQAPLVTLMSPPLMSFSTKGGVSMSCTQSVLATPHQTGGSKTCRRASKTPMLPVHLVQLDPLKKHLTRLAHLAHNSALSLCLHYTLCKYVQSLWNKHLSTSMAWIWSSMSLELLHTLTHLVTPATSYGWVERV